MKTCPACEQGFEPDYPEKVYCSQSCRLKGMSKRNRSDPAAQAARGRLGGQIRGAQLKAAAEARGFRSYAKVPGTDLHEHRVVAEAVLGRKLFKGEVVHHEDLNKRNNHPSNLIVFPNQRIHAAHHKHLGQPCECPGLCLADSSGTLYPNAGGTSADARKEGDAR